MELGTQAPATPALAMVTESTNHPFGSAAAMISSSPSCHRNLAVVAPTNDDRLTVTWLIAGMVPPHQARLPPIGLPKPSTAVPLKPPAVNAASGITDQLAPPSVEISSVPASKQRATLSSNRKVCQKERVELAWGTNGGETSTRSATVGCSSENQECVGVCAWLVLQAQSVPPLSAAWVQ